MQFTKLIFLSASLLSTITDAYQTGVSFEVVAIRSGSSIQYSSFSIQDSRIVFGGANSFTGIFLPDGRIQVIQPGSPTQYLAVDGENLVLSSTGSTFSDDGADHLTFQGRSFLARPIVGAPSGSAYFSIIVPTQGNYGSSTDIPFGPRIMYKHSLTTATPVNGTATSTQQPLQTVSWLPQVNGAVKQAAGQIAALGALAVLL